MTKKMVQSQKNVNDIMDHEATFFNDLIEKQHFVARANENVESMSRGDSPPY